MCIKYQLFCFHLIINGSLTLRCPPKKSNGVKSYMYILSWRPIFPISRNVLDMFYANKGHPRSSHTYIQKIIKLVFENSINECTGLSVSGFLALILLSAGFCKPLRQDLYSKYRANCISMRQVPLFRWSNLGIHPFSVTAALFSADLILQ